MYNLFSRTTALLGLLSAAAVFTACEKDEVKITSEFGAAPVLTTITKTVMLTQEKGNEPAITYTWNPYTVALSDGSKAVSPVTYTLQLAKAGTSFATVQEISAGTGSASSITIKTVDLNTSLQGLKLPYGQSTPLDVRLKTFVAGNMMPLYSATTTLSATPYEFCAQPAAKQAWTIIGPAGKGWGDTDDVTMKYNCDAKTYSYTGPLKADSFKFRYGGAWAANLGGTAPTGGALTHDGPDMKIPAVGVYTVTLNPGPLTADGKASPSTFTISQ